jgi:hypothetical protein
MRRLVIGLTMLVAVSFGFTIYSQNFDGAWSTNNPPDSWRIFHTNPADTGMDDWHREPANASPWIDHPTPYASIGMEMVMDSTPDSMISRRIDCRGYKNVALVCSTYYIRASNEPYIAVLKYSTDDGVTFPYTLHDYYSSSPSGPVLESLLMGEAAGKESVRVAWIFYGNLSYIFRWCVDDVAVTGDSIPVWDMWCRAIPTPGARIPPGNLSPVVRFRNMGQMDQANIPVGCSLYDAAMVGLAGWADTIPFMAAGTGDRDTFFDPPYTIGGGLYYIRAWCAADSDYDRTNDTLLKSFEVSTLRGRRHDNGVVGSFDDWPLGHYGWGATFNADTSPVYLESVRVFLKSPANGAFCRYQIAVFTDDGSGVPGRMYYKSPVLSTAPSDSGWQWVYMADSGMKLESPTGRFYVFYMQVGEPPECPAIGRDADGRNPSVTWWQYRDGVFRVDSSAGGDFMIRPVFNFAPVTRANDDLRTLYVGWPEYDFVQRPFDAPVRPACRVENFGLNIASNFSVICTIMGSSGTIYYVSDKSVAGLDPGADTVISFDSLWIPTLAERCTVITRTVYADSISDNDDARYTVDIIKGAHTGRTPLNYAWVDSDTTDGPAFSWIDTAGCNRAPDLRDEDRINIPTFFDFPYYDSTYNYVYVSANGWLGVGSSNPGGTGDSTPRRIPDVSAPNNSLYPYWDNLAMGPLFGHGKLFYKTVGLSPNRYFVLIFQDVNRIGTDTANGITFEVVIRENGTILFQYLDVDCGELAFNNGRCASIGLDNPGGTDGLNYLYARPPMSGATNDPGNRLESGRAVLLFKEVRDAAALSIVSPRNYEFPGSLIPQAKIQNYGTINDSIRVSFGIGGGAGYFADTLITSLPPGESTIVSFAPWTATIGSYSCSARVRMLGDTNSHNDVASAVFVISPWAQRPDIPADWRKRKVKNAAMCYAPTTKRVYALKGSNTPELWYYDPATRVWDTLKSMPLLPSGSKPRDGAHFAFDPDHGTQGSIWALKGGGRADFYQYDIANDSWITRRPAVVVYGSGRPYIPPKKGAALEYIPGRSMLYAIPGSGTNYFWRYDVVLDSWDFARNVSGQPVDVPYGQSGIRCKYGSDLAYGDGRLYLSKASGSAEVYAYSPELNVWVDTLSVKGFMGPRMKTAKSGSSITFMNGALYMLKGGNTQEFMRYRLTEDSWVHLSDIPTSLTGRRVKVKRGSAMTVVDSTIFALKGSVSYEFWEYKPATDSFPFFGVEPAPAREGVMARNLLDLSRPFLSVWPNPARSGLNISFNLTAQATTRLCVYDAAGKFVANLANAPRAPGLHRAHWDAEVPAGIYFLKLEGGGLALTRKFVVQR